MSYGHGWEDMENFRYPTESELDREDAYLRGEQNPDQAWINTNRDVWHKNPHYQGPPVPHPEER